MNTWTGSMSQAVSVEDFNADNFDHAGAGFVSGGSLLAMMEKQVSLMSRMPPPSAGRWGAGYKRWLAEDFRSMAHVHFWPTRCPTPKAVSTSTRRTATTPARRSEDHPAAAGQRREDLRIHVRPGARVAARGPAPRRPGGRRTTRSTSARMPSAARRMGEDAATNVTDGWQRVHEAPNVYVLGGATCRRPRAPTRPRRSRRWRCAAPTTSCRSCHDRPRWPAGRKDGLGHRYRPGDRAGDRAGVRRRGARVVGCDRDDASSAETVELVRAAGGQMVSPGVGGSGRGGWRPGWTDWAATQFGPCDVLVNSAGAIRFGALQELSFRDWRFTITHELDIVFLVTNAVWPSMLERGGSIVNVASIAASRGAGFMPQNAHGAAKAGCSR